MFESDTRGLEQGHARAERMNADYVRRTNQSSAATHAFAGAVGGLAAMLGTRLAGEIAGAGRAWLDYSAKLETTRISFVTMLGSARAADAHLRELQEFARQTPFQFAELVDASARMRALGFETQEVIPLLRDIGNVTAASGEISQDRLQRIIKALSDVRSRGALYSQEIRQFAEAAIPVYDILEKQLGKSRAELVKMVEAGQVSADTFFRAFQKFSQQNFGDLMQQQSRTFTGAMSNIKDALLQTSHTAFKPLFDQISQISVRMADELTGARGIPGIVSASENTLIDAGVRMADSVAVGFVTTFAERVGEGVERYFTGDWLEVRLARRAGRGVSGFFERLAPDYFGSVPSPSDVRGPAFSYGPMSLPGGAHAEATREQIKLQEKLRDLVGDLGRELRFYGDTSEVAATKQRLLAAGVNDLTEGFARQALALAGALDAERRYAEERERFLDDLKESIDQETEAFRWVEAQQNAAGDAILELSAAARGGMTNVERFAQAAFRAGVGVHEWRDGVLGVSATIKGMQGSVDAALQSMRQWDREAGKVAFAEFRKRQREEVNPPSIYAQMAVDINKYIESEQRAGRVLQNIGKYVDALVDSWGNVRDVQIEADQELFIYEVLWARIDALTLQVRENLKEIASIKFPDIKPILPAGGDGAELKPWVDPREAGDAPNVALARRMREAGALMVEESRFNWMQMAEDGRHIFGDFFMDLQNGWKSAMGNMALSFLQSLNQMAAQAAASAVWGVILKAVGGALGGAFAGAAVGGAGSSIGAAASRSFAGGFAEGGFIPPGMWGIVGERGPEPVFAGRTGATVQPAGGPVHYHKHLHVLIPPPTAPNSYQTRRSQRDAAEMLMGLFK